MQRHIGGGRGIRAAQVEGQTRVDAGRVKVQITTGAQPGQEWRTIGLQHLDPTVMDEVADLIRSGRDTDAADLFQRHVLAQYGGANATGVRLDEIMEILDFEDGTRW